MSAKKRTAAALKREAFLDEIKDEVDRLQMILNDKQRSAAARDLIDYIKLHYLYGEA